MNQDKTENSAWTFERKIGVSGVVAIVMLAGSIFSVYQNFDTRMTKNELALTYQKGVNDQLKENQKEMKNDTTSAINEVKTTLRDIRISLDRLLERK